MDSPLYWITADTEEGSLTDADHKCRRRSEFPGDPFSSAGLTELVQNDEPVTWKQRDSRGEQNAVSAYLETDSERTEENESH